MDLGITGRRAIVCAASKGLGRGCAEALAAAGVDLVLNARGGAALEATAAEIRAALKLIWLHLRQVIEPSAAVGLAVVLRHRQRFAGQQVGIILSGGNVDSRALARLLG